MPPLPTIDPYDWRTLAPRYRALLDEELTAQRAPAWLARWSDLEKIVWEARAALKRDRARDLTNDAAQRAYQRFVDEVFSPFQVATRALQAKLLVVPGDVPDAEQARTLRQWRNEAGLFRAANVAIQAELSALAGRYGQRVAAMSVVVDGREMTGPELDRRDHDPERATREAAWWARQAAWQQARAAIDALFLEQLARRRHLARNAGLPDYRAYRWRELGRLDYTPADALALHAAIEAEIIPLAARRRERRRARLGIDSLRPWDLKAGAMAGPPALRFPTPAAFEAGMAGVFARVDPELGALFGRMRAGFLDLGWRKGKASGGEEWFFPVTGLPYVHHGLDGTDEGIALLLHEVGHAFHDALATRESLVWRWNYPSEFGEFAAIAMTYLVMPALERAHGGIYTPEEAARLRAEALEEVVVTWLPRIALVDAFQHWLYADAPHDLRPADLDAAWRGLSARFMPWVDCTDLTAEHGAGWQQSGLLFSSPFYMIEYALAHLGALQVWRAAQADPAAAWRAYRAALALGNTRPLPDLYAAAGARLPFEHALVGSLTRFVESAVDS